MTVEVLRLRVSWSKQGAGEMRGVASFFFVGGGGGNRSPTLLARDLK